MDYLFPFQTTSLIHAMVGHPHKLIVAGQILIAVLFAFSSADKLLHLHQFQGHVASSPLLQSFDPVMLTRLIISVELLIPLFMLFERSKVPAVGGALFLLVLFSGYLLRLSWFSTDLPCGCGNLLSGLDIRVHTAINLLFAAVSAATLFLMLANVRCSES